MPVTQNISNKSKRMNTKNNEKLLKSVWLEDCEETNDTHNDIYLSFHKENPLLNKEKQEEENLLESAFSQSEESEEEIIEAPYLDLLESSLYTITEEGDETVLLSEEEEDSIVPDEDSWSKSSEKLISLTNNYNNIIVSKSDKKWMKDVLKRFNTN